MSYFSIHPSDPARDTLARWSEAKRLLAQAGEDRTAAERTANRVARLLGGDHFKRSDDFDLTAFRQEFSELGFDEEEIEHRIKFRIIRDLRTDLERYNRILSSATGLPPADRKHYQELSESITNLLKELNEEIENGEYRISHVKDILGL